ncbi:MAG: hypothetical protein M0P94_04755 [Candidatus Absconditabacterales bacterium]|nr:hypothetical protein [Candidatus Absconditabacterales bacterium]
MECTIYAGIIVFGSIRKNFDEAKKNYEKRMGALKKTFSFYGIEIKEIVCLKDPFAIDIAIDIFDKMDTMDDLIFSSRIIFCHYDNRNKEARKIISDIEKIHKKVVVRIG